VDQIDDTENDDASIEYENSRKKSPKKQRGARVIDIEHRERILLAQLLNNKDLFIKGVAFLDKKFFESKVNKLIVEFIKDYYETYKSIPPEDAILVELGLDDVKSNWLDIDKIWPTQYLEDHLNAFIKNMSMKSAIEDSIELLAEEDYGTIEKKIKDAVNVDIDVNLGVSFDSNKDSFKALFEMLTSNEETISTGWENVDEKLDGGVNIPSLNYVLGKSGGGKSVALINLSWNYVQMGRDVVYISLELKEPKIMKRYITHSTKIHGRDIPKKEVELYNHLKKCDAKGYGRFTVHFYQPNTLNSNKLELFIRNYIQKYGTTPIIIVDYAGLMVPNGKNWQGLFERDKYVSEELRGVATLYNTVVWTADQYNRCCEINELVETTAGKTAIGKLKKGDTILGTNNEWRTVLAVSEIEEQEVYEITTKSGKKIMVSARHIFPKDVNGKMVEDNILTSLKVGDKIYIKEEA